MRAVPARITPAATARLLAALLACLVLGVPAGAAAQQGGAPSANELWRHYPLASKSSAAASPPASTAPRPAAAAPTPTPAVATPRRDDGGSSSAALLGTLTLLILTATAFLVLQRRRARAPVTEPAQQTPRLQRRRARAPVTEPAQQPPRRRPAGAVSLFDDLPEDVPVTDAEPPPGTPREPEATRPPDPDVPWTAEIGWERAPGRCRFFVVAAIGEYDKRELLARSAWLGWPPSARAPVSALAEAVADLEQALLGAGWEPLHRGDAWYAKRFSWTPALAEPLGPIIDLPTSADDVELEPFAAPRRFVRAPEWPDGSDRRWRCEIRWDTDSKQARFRAVALAPDDGGDRTVGHSVPVSSPFTGDEAVSSLEQALLAAGWERAGRGAEWYAQRFVWRGDGAPPERTEPALSEGTPPA
jgi:hypothetical protein